MSAKAPVTPCSCSCAAEVKRLEARVRKAEENTAQATLKLDALLQVMSNDWGRECDRADPAGARRRERERRMAQARIKGVI